MLVLLLGLLLFNFSCSEKENTTNFNEQHLSLNFPTVNDSINCVDSLIYLAIATKQDTNDRFKRLIINELKFDTSNGVRFYLLKLTTENNDTVSIVCDYWDYDNGVYRLDEGGKKTTFIYTCEGEGCQIRHDMEAKEVWCEINGNRTEGSLACTLNCEEKKFGNILILTEGKAAFNNLEFTAPFIITF